MGQCRSSRLVRRSKRMWESSKSIRRFDEVEFGASDSNFDSSEESEDESDLN